MHAHPNLPKFPRGLRAQDRARHRSPVKAARGPQKSRRPTRQSRNQGDLDSRGCPRACAGAALAAATMFPSSLAQHLQLCAHFTFICSSLRGQFWRTDGPSCSCLWDHPVKESKLCPPRGTHRLNSPAAMGRYGRDKTIKGVPTPR